MDIEKASRRKIEKEDEELHGITEEEKEDYRDERTAYQNASREQLEKRDQEREAAYSIEHLTKLKTRKAFWDEFTYALDLIKGKAVEKRKGAESLGEVSVIMIDLDYFKTVNDTFGHAGGDEVLRKVSALLRESVRSDDTVARYGGEELIILMRNADKAAAVRQADSLRQKIEELAFPDYPGLNVTASFGVASSEDSKDPDILVKKADDALYAAKHTGRNQVKEYTAAHEPLRTAGE